MVLALGGGGKEGKRGSKVRVSSNWQRLKAEIFGTSPVAKGYLLLTTRFQGKVPFEIVYTYDRETGRENLTLVGPLAKIDWREFLAIGLPAPMEALELRGEVTVWFVEGLECEYGKRSKCDSARSPGSLKWWKSAEGLPRRVRIWGVVVKKDMSVHVGEDGGLEMEETHVLPGRGRRHSNPSPELPRWRSRQGSAVRPRRRL